MTNIETVRAIYRDYGKGDVAAIVERVAEDVEWEYAYPDRGIPWLAPRRGREGVRAFFQCLSSELTFEKFEASTVLGEGKLVVALISMQAIVRTTKKRIIENDDAHVWHFDDRGRVKRFRHVADTLQHASALGIARLEHEASP
jgi:ketosteroid isomerase-like protein